MQNQFGIKKFPVWQAGIIGGVAATILNMSVATVGGKLLNASYGYAPLTFLPVFSGSFGGVVAATAVYSLIRRVFPKPQPVIYGTTLWWYWLPRLICQFAFCAAAYPTASPESRLKSPNCSSFYTHLSL